MDFAVTMAMPPKKCGFRPAFTVRIKSGRTRADSAVHIDELVDDAAREIYSQALARGCQCAGRNANSIFSRLQELAAADELPSKIAETLIATYRVSAL
jgi:transcription initiation factor TFIIIB Brf1 subunit/transcription initiation factor TFIIB